MWTCFPKQIHFTASNLPLFSNFPFSWNHLQRHPCIRRNNVNSFPCCRATLFNPHYSKHLSFCRPTLAPYSITPPTPSSTLLLSFFSTPIYSISMLRRYKFITVAATLQKMEEKHSRFIFRIITEPHLSCVLPFRYLLLSVTVQNSLDFPAKCRKVPVL